MIWSGWIVLSRHGVQSQLTVVDLTFIRFATALICSIPLWFFYRWRPIPWYQIILVGWGTGAVYTTLSFLALSDAKASSAGVIVNGMLPVFGALISRIWSGLAISKITLACIVLVVIADALLIGSDWAVLGSYSGLISIALLLAASLSISFYVVAIKQWGFQLMDVVVWVPIVNAISVLPVWLLSDSAILSVPTDQVVFQAVYQGIIVTLFAGFVVAFCIGRLGAVTTSLFMAFVPAVTSVLALLVLGEIPGLLAWAGIVICTVALIINASQAQLLRLFRKSKEEEMLPNK